MVEVWLVPNSSCTKLIGIVGGAIKLRVKSPPIEGRANRECLQYLASIFSLPPSSLSVWKGKKGRHKQVFLPIQLQKVKKIIYQMLDKEK